MTETENEIESILFLIVFFEINDKISGRVSCDSSAFPGLPRLPTAFRATWTY